MFRYLYAALFLCLKAVGQSPESVEVHIKLDPSGQLATYSYVLNSLPEGEYTLHYAEGVSLVEEQAYRQNLPFRADCSKGKDVAVFRVEKPVDRWKFRFQQNFEDTKMLSPIKAITLGRDCNWPVSFPENWNPSVLLSLEAKEPELRIIWSQEAHLIVDGKDGYRNWFFEASPEINLNSIALEIGEAELVAVNNRPGNLSIPPAESQERSYLSILPAEPSKQASQEEKSNYALTLENYWVKNGNINCTQLQTDSDQLFGKKRDKELLALEEKLAEGRINPMSFVKALQEWRYSEYSSWFTAQKMELAQDQDRNLQFNFNRRSVYADVVGKFDLLGDTSSIDIRLKRWLFGNLDSTQSQEAICSAITSEGAQLPEPWKAIITAENRPIVKIRYRHKRSEGKLYVYAEQLQSQPINFKAQIEVHTQSNTEKFNIGFRGRRDTIILPISSSIKYLVIDPENLVPVYWKEEKSDLQLLTEFQETQEKSRRFELLDALLETKNVNLRRTAIGIGLRDEWKEVRIMSVLSCEQLSDADWEFMKVDIERLAKQDKDPDVQSYAQDLLLER